MTPAEIKTAKELSAILAPFSTPTKKKRQAPKSTSLDFLNNLSGFPKSNLVFKEPTATNEVSPHEIAGKLNTLTEAIDSSVIRGMPSVKEIIEALRGLQGNERLDISNIRNGENLARAAQKITMNDQRWHGGGSSVANLTVGSTTISSGSAGGVLYDDGIVLQEDPTKFFWDTANHRLILGSNSSPLAANSNQLFANKAVDMINYGATPFISFYRANGALGGPSPLGSGLAAGGLAGGGYDGSAWAQGGLIEFVSGEGWTGSTHATYITMYTTALGSTTAAQRLTIASDGHLGINNVAASISMGRVVSYDTAIAQLVSAYDATHYGSITTASTGSTTFALTGSSPTYQFSNSVGFGTSPTAVVHLAAGTASASTAPLKFTSGTNLSTTEGGAIEFDGTHLYFTATNAGTRFQLDQQTGSGVISFTEVTGTSQTAAINNGYITNNVSLVTVTLPITAAVGAVVEVVGSGSGGWKVAQNAGQVVNFGTAPTTSGTGGSLASIVRYDAVRLICITANTTWTALSPNNITVT